MNRDDVIKILNERHGDEPLSFKKYDFVDDCDLSNLDLHNIDFTDAIGERVNFSNSNLQNCNFTGTRLEHIIFDNADLRNAILKDCDMRFASFKNADCRGTEFLGTVMEGSNHDGIIVDDTTKHYKMACPETGAFLGYKKCFNDLLVTLLIPEDAKRVSATTRPCRCSKAKVINITSFDYKDHYTEAYSLCGPGGDFKYALGEYVYPDAFTEDRWNESSHGIHFWMTPEEAMAY